MNYPVIVILLAVMLSACSVSNDENKTETNSQDIEMAIHQPLDKAKAAEQQVLDSADLQRKQMDDM